MLQRRNLRGGFNVVATICRCRMLSLEFVLRCRRRSILLLLKGMLGKVECLDGNKEFVFKVLNDINCKLNQEVKLVGNSMPQGA